jgi:hypothetical protein
MRPRRHRHRPAVLRTYGYAGPIEGARHNPRAHGGVRHVEWCLCGYVRRTNANGLATEKGPWSPPDP